jgi:hypothetical protein
MSRPRSRLLHAKNSGLTTVCVSETTLVRLEGSNEFSVYYSGDNSVGPTVCALHVRVFIRSDLRIPHRQIYSLALFQYLATSAGYDPVAGPGSSCSAQGQCVVPWAGGTKNVNSVVLIANGVSFAVWLSTPAVFPDLKLNDPHIDHDSDLHDCRFNCRLWCIRPVAAFCSNCDLLGCAVCERQFNW